MRGVIKKNEHIVVCFFYLKRDDMAKLIWQVLVMKSGVLHMADKKNGKVKHICDSTCVSLVLLHAWVGIQYVANEHTRCYRMAVK